MLKTLKNIKLDEYTITQHQQNISSIKIKRNKYLKF